LKAEKEIEDYRVFDGKLIENYLIKVGYSHLLMPFFPLSYKAIKPIHKIFNDYLPVKCDVCEKDLLEALYHEERNAVTVQASSRNGDSVETVEHMYFACKGACDQQLNNMIYKEYKMVTGWNDITDLVIPLNFLRYLIVTLNRFNNGKYKYTIPSPLNHLFRRINPPKNGNLVSDGLNRNTFWNLGAHPLIL
jgi:hypothetical protein